MVGLIVLKERAVHVSLKECGLRSIWIWLDAVCGDDADYLKVFFSWLGFDLNADNEKERNIIRFLTIISESAYYKLIDNEVGVVFNLESVYKAVLSHTDAVVSLVTRRQRALCVF